MKTKRTNIITKVMAVTLSVLMLAAVFSSALLFAKAADEVATTAATEYLTYPFSQLGDSYRGYTDIPMIVIQISSDADGDGVDDNPDGSGYAAVTDPNNPAYGENWCHTTDEQWVSSLFGDTQSLTTYYRLISDNNFAFVPAEETYGTANDGVIHVIVENRHPRTRDSWVSNFVQIIEAASEYVDFSKYDANGNGIIDKYELALCFIFGGYEDSSSSATDKEPWGINAYYKDYMQQLYDTSDPSKGEYNKTTTDGVTVGASGFFIAGALSGGAPLRFGVFAHELGHYLGLPDLYDYSSKYDGAVLTSGLMTGGSHGSNPAHPTAWSSVELGFVETQGVGDGEYTLYARSSKEGKYNVIRINTPNPNEYYLLECRYPDKDNVNYADGVVGAAQQGVYIYHVDEKAIINSGMKVNSNYDYDPGLVLYNPRTTNVLKQIAVAAFRPTTGTYNNNVFEVSKYTFPVSGTWYTSMSEAEAEIVKNLKVEVLSEAGPEMKIRITGAYIAPPTLTTVLVNKTMDSFAISGKITNMNSATINNITATATLNGTVAATGQVKLALDGTFEYKFEGLEAGKTYKYAVTIDSSNGTAEATGVVPTVQAPVVATSYKINIYKNLKEGEKPTSQTVKFGEKFTYSFPMTKKGYAFMGWYLDEACTEKFDMDFTQNEANDITIYAKWVPEAEAATLKVSGATVTNNIFSVNVGETFIVPIAKDKAGFTFGGWYADEAFTTEFDFTAPVSANGTITVYAKWIENEPEATEPPVTEPPVTEPGDTEEPAGVNITTIIIIVVLILVAAGFVALTVVRGTKKKSPEEEQSKE